VTPANETELDESLSKPRAETIAALEACPGDILVLGAGGKMGPTLARMAVRAANGSRRVIAVSRWTSPTAERSLNDVGVETAYCDLLDRDSVAQLPDAPNIIFMAGQKFGTTGAPAMTWAMNTVVPANVAYRFRHSRIVAFSTGNVYALTPVASGGSREDDALGPVGEYAASCVGRERTFELYAELHGARVALLRLNYAVDLRYGVLVDIAARVHRGEAVSVDMGYVNVIWQGDANRIALECLPETAVPPFVVNVTGPEKLSVRATAEWFAKRFEMPARFTGVERPDALLSDTTRLRSTFSPLEVSTEQLMSMVADWIERGGALLGKPTKFEARDGKF
jgi:nucleoside-diphosphate-sugar epimerase